MWDLIVSVPDHCLSFYFPSPYLHPITPMLFFNATSIFNWSWICTGNIHNYRSLQGSVMIANAMYLKTISSDRSFSEILVKLCSLSLKQCYRLSVVLTK